MQLEIERIESRTTAIQTESLRSILWRKGGAVWSISPHATVYDAIEMMDQKRVGALMVVDEGRLVGVISERDYARKVILRGRLSRETRVSEIMTAEVITAHPEQSVDDGLRVMTGHRIRHLPVLEGDNLVGVVSIGDLVNAIISAQAAALDHLNSYISGGYPG